MIELVAGGIVYQNPKPYLRALHTWHPTVVRLDSGELLVAFDAGSAVEALDYHSRLTRSSDEGLTWSEPVSILRETSEPPTTNSLRLSRTLDGTLIAYGGRYHRDDPEEGLVNRANLGYVPMDLVLLTSADGGRSWTPPRPISPPLVGPSWEACHRLIELPDGRWLAPTSTWKGWHGQAPNGMKAVALVSRDRGHSWPEAIDVFDAYSQNVISWELSVEPLPDGRLLGVCWSYHEPTGKTLPTPYALYQGGTAFGPARPTGLHGQTMKLLGLGDGRVLALYRRNDRPGLWANVSRIVGEEWVNLAEAVVWQGAGSGMAGKGSSADELSDLKFGFPQMTSLPGGEVFAVFWCVESCLHVVRWARLRITE